MSLWQPVPWALSAPCKIAIFLQKFALYVYLQKFDLGLLKAINFSCCRSPPSDMTRSLSSHVLVGSLLSRHLYARSPIRNDPVISEIIFSTSQRRRNELPRCAQITSKSTSWAQMWLRWSHTGIVPVNFAVECRSEQSAWVMLKDLYVQHVLYKIITLSFVPLCIRFAPCIGFSAASEEI